VKDSTDLIKRSLSLQKPIILVHIAYRLNLFGYTAFKDEVNFGFHDQKRGIEWVKNHISDFGGDPVRQFASHIDISAFAFL
jgi:carboxylesterase type B